MERRNSCGNPHSGEAAPLKKRADDFQLLEICFEFRYSDFGFSLH
jgi:hypothetical protein